MCLMGEVELYTMRRPASGVACAAQAKEALAHEYFDDFEDRAAVDALESEAIRVREG